MSKFKYVVDNLGGNTVGNLLKSGLQSNQRSSFASAYFTVSGFEIIANQLEKTRDFRLLLGSEPGAKPLDAMIMDIWRNIDIRDNAKHAERAIEFFNRKDVQVRLHPGPFFHGKTYILNHPVPQFTNIEDAVAKDEGTKMVEHYELETGRPRPSTLKYLGEEVRPGTGAMSIVGSSNFTYGGLTKNTELNLFDYTGTSVSELLTWYEERWNDSTDFKEDLQKVLNGYYKPFDPFWIYAKALYELYKEDLGIEGEEQSSTTIELADFQYAGYKSATRIVKQWGGVLIADAPGLGKTYMAGKILEDYARIQLQYALIICPAEVEPIWDKFTREKQISVKKILHTEVLGRGMREGLPEIKPEDYKDCSIILVDESHHFRNPDAGRYQWLQQLMALPKPKIKQAGKVVQLERKVIFVTATPVNNSVWDLYWQLYLLFGNKIEEIAFRQGISDISKYFEGAETGKGNLYDLIEKVAVRRSRAFIRERYPDAMLNGVPIRFPQRELENVSYGLDARLGKLYQTASAAVDKLHLVPYRLEGYKTGPRDEIIIKRAEILSILFKVLLLKRLESSLWSLRESTFRLNELFKSTLEQLEQGTLMEPRVLREYQEIAEALGEDGANSDVEIAEEDQLNLDDYDIDTIKSHLKEDILTLTEILAHLPQTMEDLVEMDNKCKEVIAKVRKIKGKVLIFTTFMDTATYLFNALQKLKVPIGFVTGDVCSLWTGKECVGSKRSRLIEKFSPISNQSNIPESEQINILLATDVFSEAINLQDANNVLNYDLPWNPMKLVQRAGRVDRMGSNHKKVFVINVFPEKGLEDLLKLMKKLQNKIAQTHRAVGLEHSILGEQPLSVDFASTIERVKNKDVRVLVDIEKDMEGLIGLDPQEQLLAILQHLSKDEIERIPDGAGSFTAMKGEDEMHKPGFFISYRRRRKNTNEIDRIWRYYPEEGSAISSKTEMIQYIQFPRDYPPINRLDEITLSILREKRIALEKDLERLDQQQRTPFVSGPIRKAFELVQRMGRADLYEFLQNSAKKGAIERAIRKLSFKNEEKAIKVLEKLMSRFGIAPDETVQEFPPVDMLMKAEADTFLDEIAPIPTERNPELELVCWMRIINDPDKATVTNWEPEAVGQKKFKGKSLEGQAKI